MTNDKPLCSENPNDPNCVYGLEDLSNDIQERGRPAPEAAIERAHARMLRALRLGGLTLAGIGAVVLAARLLGVKRLRA